MSAEEIIQMQKHLEAQDALFRSNFQDTANFIFPRESNITHISFPGTKKTERLYDITAIMESERMTSGLLANLIPAGQKFFAISTSNEELLELDVVKSYLADATKTLHEELFSSNFILQITETLHSDHVFGTACIFEDYQNGLNFMDWDVSRFQFLEDFRGRVNAIYLKFPKTAQQAFDEWGDKAGESILEIFGPNGDSKNRNNRFWFIHAVRPRKHRIPRLEDALNMEWESVYVNIKDRVIVDEGGFPEFPYQVPRWAKTSDETHGRGIGTEILPQVKMVNAIKRDFNELSNKTANPHREVLESFEGEYDTTPGGRNDVMELPSSLVDERQFGNFVVTKDMLEMERQVIKDAFFNKAFAPLTDLTGDRRNQLEIQERIQEAFRQIGSPIGRLESELFTPLITRSYFLLVRKERIPPPPVELQGRNLKIVYKGPLSLAQQNAEVRASQQWIGVLSEMSGVPGLEDSIDNVNADNAAREMGRVFGVNEETIASEEEVEAKRKARQKALERQQALEAAQVAAGAYGQTTSAPEAGSAAEQIQAGAA
jgi:hypothetical protein